MVESSIFLDEEKRLFAGDDERLEEKNPRQEREVQEKRGPGKAFTFLGPPRKLRFLNR